MQIKGIKIKVEQRIGCDKCVFHGFRGGESEMALSCAGAWLMREAANVDCTDGYQFTAIKTKEKAQ